MLSNILTQISTTQRGKFNLKKKIVHKKSYAVNVSRENYWDSVFVDDMRRNGHFHAGVNPVAILNQDIGSFDMGRYENVDETLVDQLHSIYCGSIGYDFDHILPEERKWMVDMIEDSSQQMKENITNEERVNILKHLIESEQFDLFLGVKYPHVKRYSLEGNESFIVLMDILLKELAHLDYTDTTITLPHRGRLNLLCNLLGYPYEALFSRLQGNPTVPEDVIGTDDVLSHIAQSIDLSYENKSLHVSLIHNPSHLEASAPVLLGKTKAKQEEAKDTNMDKVFPVVIHGDAAIAGQGIVYESLSLSGLPGFTTGGVLHVVVNNQIGFTTQKADGRATHYCTDIAKAYGIPIFHVNSTKPEEVLMVTKMALAYRNKFKKDVFIDLIGWRKHGHNEVDEPAFTQPELYKWIKKQSSSFKSYQQQLIDDEVVSLSDIDDIKKNFRNRLEALNNKTDEYQMTVDQLKGKWSDMVQPKDITGFVDTGVDIEVLKKIGEDSINFKNTKVHNRLKKMYADKRSQVLTNQNGIDWSTAESLAIGSLLEDGYNVRISGQDVGRGTFSHRHCIIVDQDNNTKYIPFNNVKSDNNNRGKLTPVNSFLSEFAVLGFEYGYSWESPNTLPIWEAQFGDFFNGAQIIFDQFISSGEDKWFRQSGLTVFLPHGYEATGPEHSSCRLERFLQMSNSDYLEDTEESKRPGMRVVLPTTPSNCFHMLRRQMVTDYRKPLIVAAPKSILRHKYSLSTLDEFAPGTGFIPVIGDHAAEEHPETVEHVILCSGKAAFELRDLFAENNINNTAIIRIEELVPFPYPQIEEHLNKYTNASRLIWYQEEPQNMGAYSFVEPRLRNVLNKQVDFVGQPPLNAVSEGTPSRHKKAIIEVNKKLLSKLQ